MNEFIAFAQTTATTAPTGQTLDAILGRIYYYIVNPAILLLFAVATIIFIWGVVSFIRGSNDKTEKQKGQDHMLWGIVGFVIMVGVYGILNFFMQIFGINNIVITPTQSSIGKQTIPNVKVPNFTSSGN